MGLKEGMISFHRAMGSQSGNEFLGQWLSGGLKFTVANRFPKRDEFAGDVSFFGECWIT